MKPETKTLIYAFAASVFLHAALLSGLYLHSVKAKKPEETKFVHKIKTARPERFDARAI